MIALKADGQTVTLDEEQAQLLATSMRIAVEKYAEDARTCEALPERAGVGLAEQFRRQEAQAREICGLLEVLGYC